MRRLIAMLLLVSASTLHAQDSASLLADSVSVNADSTITAEGNVEVLYQDVRLTARRIVYDREADTLQIDGPIRLNDGERVTVLADTAELDRDLQNGIMTGARMVLDQQLQLAAAELSRADGRYTQLYKTVASSCQVCTENGTPLWEIRAKRVIHDQQERQIYFEHAQFRVVGIPVVYFPRLRLPDPTLERANGFLIPDIRSTSELGTGLKWPYFITLGRSADLTVTPYLSSRTRTIELRYRQVFRTGNITFTGAASRDEIQPEETRAYLFGSGTFRLPRDFRLDFDLEVVTDRGYLQDYDYSGADRLESVVRLSRTRRNEFIDLGFVNFRTLRDSEVPIEDQLPYFVADFLWEKRFQPLWPGGEVRLVFNGQGYSRTSDADVLGRDVLRAGVRLEWRRDWLLSNGMIAAAETDLAADLFKIGQDPNFEPTLTHFTPTVAAELRWPLSRTTASGATHLLEPVAQIAWTDSIGPDVPNEDSTLVEFDEGNLLSLSRFPGNDVYERGTRATVGLRWTRYDPSGWSVGATVGRVFRSEVPDQFTQSSGLDGIRSDWLAAAYLTLSDELSLSQRALFDDEFDVTKSESRLTWSFTRAMLAGSYVWTLAEPAEGRPDATSEWIMDTTYQINRHWTAEADWRYDFTVDRAARAGLGIGYQNECIRIDLSLSRRFTSSTSVNPTTGFGLRVSLNGFGNDGRAFRRSCTR